MTILEGWENSALGEETTVKKGGPQFSIVIKRNVDFKYMEVNCIVV